MNSLSRVGILALVALIAAPVCASISIIDFEGIPDSTVLLSQYPGLTFQNASAISTSLNEREFPFHSGLSAAYDSGGFVTISFTDPVLSAGAFFTYMVPLTFRAYDGNGSQVASTASIFSSNLAISGSPGSSPNEFVSLTSRTGISKVTLSGDPGGGSFVFDDLTYDTFSGSVPPVITPESSQVSLLMVGGSILAARAFGQAIVRARRRNNNPEFKGAKEI